MIDKVFLGGSRAFIAQIISEKTEEIRIAIRDDMDRTSTIIDCVGGYCYAYVMRNEELGTRYFRFPLPSVKDGEIDPRFGVKCAVLRACDVLDSFDCEYHRYIQGGIMYRGKIYSSEGFTDNEKNRPAIRVIDTVEKRQEEYCDLLSIGYNEEPEMIDFYRGRCLYSDACGSLYELSFER
jgi:hypothetical protein